jgi:hypothetical protein
MFTGNKAYHIVINGDYHILCNSGADDKNLLFQGAENLGNSFLIPDTDKVIDLFKSQGEGEFTINKDTFNTVTLNNTEGVVKNTYTPMYVESDNLFSRRSFLASINRTMVAIDWDHAIPMSIKPGQAVKYCYDTDGKYSAKGGVCHRVSYHVRPTDGVGKKLYTCKAKLTLSTES